MASLFIYIYSFPSSFFLTKNKNVWHAMRGAIYGEIRRVCMRCWIGHWSFLRFFYCRRGIKICRKTSDQPHPIEAPRFSITAGRRCLKMDKMLHEVKEEEEERRTRWYVVLIKQITRLNNYSFILQTRPATSKCCKSPRPRWMSFITKRR